MRTKSIRTVAATAAIGAVAAAATVTLFGSGAGAAPKSNGPVDSGSATISMSPSTLASLSASGLSPWQTGAPATTGADPNTAGNVAYTFPVTGGTISVQNLYGYESLGGTLTLSDYNTGKSVTLREPQFDINSDVVSAVPAPTHKRMAFFDTRGQIVFNGTASQKPMGNESFSASDLQVDPAGAAYLNNALGETVFTAGESVGSFSTSFHNPTDT